MKNKTYWSKCVWNIAPSWSQESVEILRDFSNEVSDLRKGFSALLDLDLQWMRLVACQEFCLRDNSK
jgi:hypothetical protein